MLFTKECDYAIRIMRALSTNELISVSKICTLEHMTSAMAYKIARKLEKAGLIKSYRGTNGGYALNKDPKDIALYDVCSVIDPELLLIECMKIGSYCPMNNPSSPCNVHHEFCRLQNLLLNEMKSKNLKELFGK